MKRKINMKKRKLTRQAIEVVERGFKQGLTVKALADLTSLNVSTISTVALVLEFVGRLQ